MTNRGKKSALEGDVLDIISNLPSNVTDHILDFLPIRDAARTCVLSRKWRDIWASHPNIKIGYNLVQRILEFTTVEFTNIVSKILLHHIGPILKFNLQFPLFDRNEFDLSFVDHWLHYLSRKGIRELTLNCEAKEPYILPSHIFSASELVILNLTNCIFNSPIGHVDFHKVKSFYFSGIKFRPSQVTSVLNTHTPQLTFLSFKSCTGVCNLKICAPKLKTLILERSEEADLIGFEMSEVTTIALVGRCGYKGISLTKLFEKCPLLSSFYVDGDSFEYLVADTQLEGLPLMTSCLKHLVLQQIKWCNLHQVSSILYLLQRSTTLSRLEISGRSYGRRDVANLLSNHLDAAQSMNWTTNSLEIVIVDEIYKAKEEMEFIKFLLSCSPRLKRMFVEHRRFNGDESDHKANLKLSKRLMRFPRASKEAEIIFEPNVKVTKLSSLK